MIITMNEIKKILRSERIIIFASLKLLSAKKTKFLNYHALMVIIIPCFGKIGSSKWSNYSPGTRPPELKYLGIFIRVHRATETREPSKLAHEGCELVKINVSLVLRGHRS